MTANNGIPLRGALCRTPEVLCEVLAPSLPSLSSDLLPHPSSSCAGGTSSGCLSSPGPITQKVGTHRHTPHLLLHCFTYSHANTHSRILHTLTPHTQMHMLLVVNETHSHARSPTNTSHTQTQLIHLTHTHTHTSRIHSPTGSAQSGVRGLKRGHVHTPTARHKVCVQSGQRLCPCQWLGLNSSGYFPNNRSLCPNSPSTASRPATWSLILLLAFLFLHAGCVQETREQAARGASKRSGHLPSTRGPCHQDA